MHAFDAMGRNPEEVQKLLLSCLKDPTEIPQFVLALCHLSEMQEQQEPNALFGTVLIFTHRWRSRVNEIELNNLLQISLAKAVLGQGEDWRRLLTAAVPAAKAN